MNAKVTQRLALGSSALLIAGGIAACSDDASETVEPPAVEDTQEPQAPEQDQAPDEGASDGGEGVSDGAPLGEEGDSEGGGMPGEQAAPEGGVPGEEDAPEGGVPGEQDAPEDGLPGDGGAPDDGGAPPQGGAPEEDGAVEGQPASTGEPGVATYSDWLAVPLPEDWSEFEDGVWTGNDGAALHMGECSPPDEGPPLAYSDCVEFVPNVGQPSASDPTTEVDIQQLQPVAEGLNATEVSVSDEQTEVVYWIVENQETAEVAVLEYNSEGVDEAVVESVREMTLQ
ncbi:hypothetical protein [Georgenia sp. Z1491]|uniref:hypothetical protein n=1 Tax=Georgenia sp. Z1491 TaxID=3416707 RepID=UPI003CF50CD3